MIPFHVSYVFGVVFKRAGVVLANDDGIQLVFNEGATSDEPLEDNTKSVVISWENLAAVTPKQSMFGDSLTIQVRNAGTIKAFPGAKQDSVTLSIDKSLRNDVDQFVQKVQAYQNGSHQDVDDMIDDIRDFLTGL